MLGTYALTCPHPLSTLNNEKSKLNTNRNEVSLDLLEEAALFAEDVKVVCDLIVACAVRRIVVKFIVLGS
jgi:hypothetical protein